MPSQQLVCSRCKVLPELVREKGNREMIRCPRCGVFGDREKVMKSAAEHFNSSQIRDLQDSLKRQSRGSKTVRYIPGKLPNRQTPDFIFN